MKNVTLATSPFPSPLSRVRPSIVTKYAMVHMIVGIIFVILGAYLQVSVGFKMSGVPP